MAPLATSADSVQVSFKTGVGCCDARGVVDDGLSLCEESRYCKSHCDSVVTETIQMRATQLPAS